MQISNMQSISATCGYHIRNLATLSSSKYDTNGSNALFGLTELHKQTVCLVFNEKAFKCGVMIGSTTPFLMQNLILYFSYLSYWLIWLFLYSISASHVVMCLVCWIFSEQEGSFLSSTLKTNGSYSNGAVSELHLSNNTVTISTCFIGLVITRGSVFHKRRKAL